MKLLVEHGMEHADAENDGISDKISASSSSVAGWWVISMSRCDICTIGMTLVFYPVREHIINNNSAKNGPSAITWDGAR